LERTAHGQLLCHSTDARAPGLAGMACRRWRCL